MGLIWFDALYACIIATNMRCKHTCDVPALARCWREGPREAVTVKGLPMVMNVANACASNSQHVSVRMRRDDARLVTVPMS
jgi:hypothetical protein